MVLYRNPGMAKSVDLKEADEFRELSTVEHISHTYVLQKKEKDTAGIVANSLQFNIQYLADHEERELEEFLLTRNFLSKDERKYLGRYVVKGIPDHLQG